MDENERRGLKVLITEDSEDDALLILRELKRGGYLPEAQRVDTASDMQTALETSDWDLIIADHNMPGFDSYDALALAQQHDPNIPFILVSGSIGEEVAVDAMKAGAHDYVMKHNLTRLLPAIERELREAANRRAHQQAQATIHHMAYHDHLTELLNRVEFERRLNNAVESARTEDEIHALLYVDLDQFKLVNDSCGHLAGDELLRRIAKRMQRSIRESDSLARLGGDEFGVLLKNCPLERAEGIALSVLENIRTYQFIWSDRSFKVGASIGLVRVNGNEDASALMSLADMACYAAKDKGRNRVHIYSESDKQMSLRRGEIQWVQRLQHAMQKDKLVLYHQRIQSLQGSDSHHEVLIRMVREDGSLIMPGQFIPAAERYNLMPEIDRWVVHHACAQMHKELAGNSPGILFINLSATSLSDDQLVKYIREQLQLYGIPPDRITFEITETAAISDFDCALDLIKTLRHLGCKVALDDFGTGMSSFSYLKSLDVDFLKIDGGFVRSMLEDPMDHAIVEAINSIGHIAGIRTIAEFVESQAIMQRLSTLGIDFAQGWAVHHPQPFTEHRNPVVAPHA
ncbi:MAG: EAL domain-containing protein [Gammaproteobacteria bacterium]|nr:EAL domain-containing protein [Gammaproteobacteria bacterium]